MPTARLNLAYVALRALDFPSKTELADALLGSDQLQQSAKSALMTGLDRRRATDRALPP